MQHENKCISEYIQSKDPTRNNILHHRANRRLQFSLKSAVRCKRQQFEAQTASMGDRVHNGGGLIQQTETNCAK